MKCHDLREFLQRLADAGELHEVTVEVSPELEIAAITDRICKAVSPENKGLLFSRVSGSDYRVATNLFGSEKRLATALGLENCRELAGLFAGILAKSAGDTAEAQLRSLPKTGFWKAAAPLIEDRLPQKLKSFPGGLSKLPVLKNHPHDGEPHNDGRFLTLPLVITTNPGFTEFNCGLYRAAVISEDTLAIPWSEGSGAAAHHAAWLRTGKPMHVAVALGGPPLLTLTASLPLPLDEFTLAGALSGKPLDLCLCANGLPVPTGAEAVIEGYILPEKVASGAFGNHTGSYTPSRPAVALKVTSIHCRSDMILPATVVGKPPMEDCWLGYAWGRLLLVLLQIDFPEIIELHLPFAGIFHGAAIIAAKLGRGSRELLAALRRTSWLKESRLLILVDSCEDPADESAVLWRAMNTVNPKRDIVISGSRVTIDATLKPEGYRAIEADAGISAIIDKRWKEYGFAG